MQLAEFPVTFTYQKVQIQGTCQKIDAFTTPLLRVTVGEEDYPPVYIFWLLKDGTIFTHDQKEMTKPILHALSGLLKPAFKKPKRTNTKN